MRSWLGEPRLGLAVACVALACAGAKTGAPGSAKVVDAQQFPSKEALEKLGNEPVPANLFGVDLRRVDRWELEGPFPETIADEPWTDAESAWSSLVEEVARRRAGLAVPTQSMHCVARELGRFFLAEGGQPTPSLQAFVAARCRASVADVSYQYIEGRVPEAAKEAAVFANWKASVAEALRRSLEGGPRTVGIWFGREGDHAVAMIAAGHREFVLDPIAPVAGEEGAIEIRGESLSPALAVRGLVNRGRFGVAECESVGDASELPRFRLRCPLEPDGGASLLAVSAFLPGRLLGNTGLLALVSRGDDAPTAYERPSYGESWPMLDAEKVGEDFTELLNRVRREAKLEPLALDPGQTEMATELAPHYFEATVGRADAFTADVVALGMLAGWGVDGIVESGHFASAWVLQTNDLAELLGTALEFPSGRSALLADDVQRVAIGPMLSTEKQHESFAAVFGTYALFSEKSHEAVARRVVEKLDRERERRGVEPLETLDELGGTCAQAAGAVQAGSDPTQVLAGLLRDASELLQRPVSGWITEVSDLDTLEFPEEYLKRPSLGVAVAVSHRRPKGEPWGRYVVMLVIADPEARGV